MDVACLVRGTWNGGANGEPEILAKDSEDYPNGRFARPHDPEGNPIEFWEPRGP